ncbi:hypothetical protein C1922_10285 [Stenotrophomonas sp. ZAC14D2_NAIMI4_7]|uniref:hypothetical protein n=1 Tax=Stenotrophomonas sp. ZAC14D2_NAIMI4_7 TaxID=2072405 RepID=UPI000D54082B|nr:hypothetical protein [Stenotrophomonas sp. ZAC14D2_NAIMI4_7]AWH17661.1 hypothetical protein C1922_10285 [Stenotrophomonas sp. ZAC14D2_NAIMI4_7]
MNGSLPITPDGRYIVVRGRLWRASNPHLSAAEREQWVARLMTGRRAVQAAMRAGNREALRRARRAVDEAKRGLGERGPVWWQDGDQDYNRHLVKNSPYADWFEKT